jgi:predicted  nucleic acid-binding Zn-ribbon protein
LVSFIPTYPPTLQCIFILYPYQAIDRLSKGSLSTDVESMRTKKLDKCIINEMEEDIRKELKEIREEFMELQNNVTECKTDIADNKQNIADNKQNIADNRQEIDNINTMHIPLHIKSKL